VAAGYHHPIQLLLTDVVMPEMGAGELAERLLAVRPEIRILFISGYTNDEILRRGISRQEAAFIQKPFTGQDLMKKVRAVLDGDGKPTAPDPSDSATHRDWAPPADRA
jgi:DNA-binding NarL/FixJ family response regulator